jgi:hypothetical protein
MRPDSVLAVCGKGYKEMLTGELAVSMPDTKTAAMGN